MVMINFVHSIALPLFLSCLLFKHFFSSFFLYIIGLKVLKEKAITLNYIPSKNACQKQRLFLNLSPRDLQYKKC